MNKELFAIQIALQERNEQAQLRLRGVAEPQPRLREPVLQERPKHPVRRPKPVPAPQGIAAFLGKLRKPAEYLDLTA